MGAERRQDKETDEREITFPHTQGHGHRLEEQLTPGDKTYTATHKHTHIHTYTHSVGKGQKV